MRSSTRVINTILSFVLSGTGVEVLQMKELEHTNTILYLFYVKVELGFKSGVLSPFSVQCGLVLRTTYSIEETFPVRFKFGFQMSLK